MWVVWVAVLLLLYVCYWWPRRHLWIHGRKLPGPTCLPFIGNLAMFSRDNCKNFKLCLKLNEIYGSVYRLWVGSELYIILTDPEALGKVFGNPRVQDHNYQADKGMDLTVKNGLIAIAGDKWRLHHRLILPAFNRNILRTYVEIFSDEAMNLEKSLHELADGKSVDIYNFFGNLSLTTVKQTVVGVENTSQKKLDFRIIMRSSNIVARRILRPWLLVDWIYQWTNDRKELVAMAKMLKNFSEGVIAEKQADYRRGIKRTGMVTSGGKKINSFLDMMIEASESQGSLLSAEDLRDEVSAIIMAGTETTALTMSFLTILIGIHTDIQDEIHEELDSIFGDSQRPVVAEDLDKMFVLERAIKETLRLFPSLTLLPRVLPEDIPVNDDWTFPKGAVAWLDTFSLHRNAKYYKDPQRFIPDRWLASNTDDTRHPYAYLPYSGGQRPCIGTQYAMLQMKTSLSTVLRQLRVSTDLTIDKIVNNLNIGLTVVMNKEVGFPVQLKKRIPA